MELERSSELNQKPIGSQKEQHATNLVPEEPARSCARNEGEPRSSLPTAVSEVAVTWVEGQHVGGRAQNGPD